MTIEELIAKWEPNGLMWANTNQQSPIRRLEAERDICKFAAVSKVAMDALDNFAVADKWGVAHDAQLAKNKIAAIAGGTT